MKKARPSLFGDPARLLRTRSFVGDKSERNQFRQARQAARRENMLKRMTPEQRDQALKQEAGFKARQSADQKAASDQKLRDTKGITGTKAERERFQADKQALRREDMLKAMTPEQRDQALKQEAEFKEAEKAQVEKKRQEKLRRTVAVVGDEVKREAFQSDKQALRREDMLKSMTPEQRDQALKQEAEFKEAEKASQEREAAAKDARTVARVIDRESSAKSYPLGRPTVMHVSGLTNSRNALAADLAALEQSLTALSS